MSAGIQRHGNSCRISYQNASHALDVGLIDSAGMRALTTRIPGPRMIAEPVRANLAESASKAKGARLANLLSTAQGGAEALETQEPNAIEAAILQAGRAGKRIYAGQIPGTNMNLLQALAQGRYRPCRVWLLRRDSELPEGLVINYKTIDHPLLNVSRKMKMSELIEKLKAVEAMMTDTGVKI